MSLEGMSDAERDALAALMKDLGQNPETRLPLQAVIKKAYPTTATPELDSALALRELNRKIEEQKAEYDNFKAQTDAEKVELKKWAEAVGAGHCTYEDIGAIREFMTANGLADPVKSAELWKQTSQFSTPTAPSTNVFEMPNALMEKWKTGGVRNINQTALAEGHQLMDDIRGGKVKLV